MACYVIDDNVCAKNILEQILTKNITEKIILCGVGKVGVNSTVINTMTEIKNIFQKFNEINPNESISSLDNFIDEFCQNKSEQLGEEITKVIFD